MWLCQLRLEDVGLERGVSQLDDIATRYGDGEAQVDIISCCEVAKYLFR